MRKVYLRSVGSFVPDNQYSNEELCSILGFSADKAAKYRKLLGVERRPSCIDYRNGGKQIITGEDLATNAATKALTRAELEPRQLDAVIACSSFFDYIAPPVSSRLVKRLGITETFTLDLIGGCAELLHGLKVAANMIQLGEADNVLVTSSEVINAWWRQGRYPIEYFIFGDTGGAIVLSAEKGTHVLTDAFLKTRSHIGNEPAELICVPILGGKQPAPLFYREPDMDDAVAGKSDIPAEYRLVHSIRQVALGAPGAMIDAISRLLTRRSIDPKQTFVVPHQASLGVIKALGATGVPDAQIGLSLPNRGNMSTSSVPVTLDEHWTAACAQPHLMLTAVGVGMSYGALGFDRVEA